MSQQKCECYVVGATPERREYFESVCPDGKIPVTCPVPTERIKHKDLKYPVAATKVALDRLSTTERENLIKTVQKKFHLTRLQVTEQLNNVGCPIRLDGSVIISWCQLHARCVL